MIRFIVFVVLAITFAWCGATVKLGERTFFGHVRAIWATKEAQEMNKGIRDNAKPMIDKVKRGVEAGVREATKDDKPAPPQKPERER